MPAKNKYSLADYRTQAHKPPFPLVIDENRTLEIDPPTTNVMLDVSATTDIREQLKLLAGAHYDELMEVIGEEQGAILKPLLGDMTKHFGLGE